MHPAVREIVLMGRRYDPIRDFLAGSPGFILDGREPTQVYPSGIGPYYQDQANTAALLDTAPVGLAIESSGNGALGAETIAPLDFTSGWAAVGGGAVVDADSLQTNGQSGGLTRNIGFVTGTIYRVLGNYTKSGTSVGLTFYNATAGSNPTPFINQTAASGSFDFYFRAVDPNLYVRLSAPGEVVDLPSISIKPVSGNHFLQTTANSRPTLRNVNGKWRFRGDGSDDGVFGSLVPGAGPLSLLAFMAPTADAGGADIIVGSSDGAPGNRCQIGTNDGVVVGAYGAVTILAIKGTTDIRGSSAVASMDFDGTNLVFDVLYAGASDFVREYGAAANGAASTAAALGVMANNSAGTLGSFAKADALAMFVQASRSQSQRLAAAKYLRTQAGG